MEDRKIIILDSPYAFVLMYGLIYIRYLSHLLYIPKVDQFFFPNLILLTLILVSGIILVSAKQEVDHQDVHLNQVYIWHFLSLIPTMLLNSILSKFKKLEQSRGDDIMIIWSIRILQGTVSILTISLILLIGFIWSQGNPFILLLPVYASLGLLGWTLGYILSRIRSEPSKLISTIHLALLRPIIGTQKKRKFLGITSFVFLIILFIVDVEKIFTVLQI